jgi:hypothetical protein
LLLAMFACSDPPTSSVTTTIVEPADLGYRTVVGTLVTKDQLRAEDGSMVSLIGYQTALFADLIGAESRVRGAFDDVESAPLWIVEFRVLSVDSLPALDGTLENSEMGFSIRTMDGDHALLATIPEDLMRHVGERVWLTMLDGSWVRYGLLTE